MRQREKGYEPREGYTVAGFRGRGKASSGTDAEWLGYYRPIKKQ